MNIEERKEYRTRDGRRVRIYAKDSGHPQYPIHGAFQSDGTWFIDDWTADGKNSVSLATDALDLIGPWIDLPEVNWSAMPAWARWFALDQNGYGHYFPQKPERNNSWWFGQRFSGTIPREYCPKFTGDWKDSLVKRP